MYQLIKNTEVLFEAADFLTLWKATVQHYGHLTIEEFDEKNFAIVQGDHKAKVDTDRRFRKGYFDSLAKNIAIAEIENHGMDDGRFFIHLKPSYVWYGSDNEVRTSTRSFGSIAEALDDLRQIEKYTPPALDDRRVAAPFTIANPMTGEIVPLKKGK